MTGRREARERKKSHTGKVVNMLKEQYKSFCRDWASIINMQMVEGYKKGEENDQYGNSHLYLIIAGTQWESGAVCNSDDFEMHDGMTHYRFGGDYSLISNDEMRIFDDYGHREAGFELPRNEMNIRNMTYYLCENCIYGEKKIYCQPKREVREEHLCRECWDEKYRG